MPNENPIKAVLIIRLSSIGDVVLTSPVVREVKRAFPGAELHFLIKEQYRDTIAHNPRIDKIHVLQDSLMKTAKMLRAFKFDYVLDLHHNLRSNVLRRLIPGKILALKKPNAHKRRLVRQKTKKPVRHIVERNLDVLRKMGIEPQNQYLEFFLPARVREKAASIIAGQKFEQAPLAVVVGATYRTKQWIPEYFTDILNHWLRPVVILGGPGDVHFAKQVETGLAAPYYNGAGKHDLLESAALLELCQLTVTHDTGLMHIAAALGKPVVAIWGNTTPAFGMYPWQTESIMLENNDLDCRPCSRLGFRECPKGHFYCMKRLTPEIAAVRATAFVENCYETP